MSTQLKTLFASALFSLIAGAHAQSDQTAGQPLAPSISLTEPGFHLVLNAGVTSGGDTIGTNENLKAGSGVQFGIGGLYQFEKNPIALMLSTNYHASAKLFGLETFERFPVEVLAYYTGKERFRIGGGIRLIRSPEWTYIGNKIYNDTTGLVAEVGYRMSKRSWINFRLVSEKYQEKSSTDSLGITTPSIGVAPVNGSHFGVNFSYEF